VLRAIALEKFLLSGIVLYKNHSTSVTDRQTDKSHIATAAVCSKSIEKVHFTLI